MKRIHGRLRSALYKIVVTTVLPSPLVSIRVRRVVLGWFGAVIRPPSEIRYGFDLMTPDVVIDSGVFINRDVSIANTATVVLEEKVALGPGVLITTTHHEMGDPACRAGAPTPRPIRVGRGTWVGARSVILPGVTIGAGCVIAAGAVVARDCAPNGLYAGVPARRIRDLGTGGAASRPLNVVASTSADQERAS